MRCKCNENMVLIKLGLKQNKSALCDYCNNCGRLHISVSGMQGTWYESKQSTADRVNRSDIYTILNEELPEDATSMADRAKVEVIGTLKDKIVTMGKK